MFRGYEKLDRDAALEDAIFYTTNAMAGLKPHREHVFQNPETKEFSAVATNQGLRRETVEGWIQHAFTNGETPNVRLMRTELVAESVRNVGGERAFKRIPHVVAERFWERREEPYVRTMLAHICLYNGPHLNPEKDRERGIVESKNEYSKGAINVGLPTLCSQAEPRMERAVRNRNGLIVNDLFFTKLGKYGDIVGLCLANTRMQNGQLFLKDVYYRPRYEDMGVLEMAYDASVQEKRGVGSITTRVIWSPARALSKGEEGVKTRRALDELRDSRMSAQEKSSERN